MGERYALGATAFHRPSGMIRKTKVRMRALYRYSTDKKAKYEAMRNSSPYQVQESENEMSHVMAKRGFQLSTDEGGVPSKDPLQHMSDFTEALTRLSHFHSSRKVLDLHWQAKRARKSEFDRAVHQILVMVGGASHLQAGRQKVIFGFGDAKVGGWCGPFMDYLVLKLKSLGYKHIYYVDESYTSQYCPRCGSTASLVPNSKVRIKECDECGVYFHRDEMAGHNIANTLEFYTLHGRRPDYLPSSRRN